MLQYYKYTNQIEYEESNTTYIMNCYGIIAANSLRQANKILHQRYGAMNHYNIQKLPRKTGIACSATAETIVHLKDEDKEHVYTIN